MPAINVRECKDADEFFDVLSPRSPLEKGCSYIYRGQRNAAWSLAPKVFRNDLYITKKILKINGLSEDVKVTFNLQDKSELYLIQQFVAHADLLGLNIPTDSYKLRNEHIFSQSGSYYKWPDPQLIDILALAQHHGVPTRLLDWTYRAYVAAYFAALSDQNEKGTIGDNDKIAVWALNLGGLYGLRNIEHVKVPRSTSKNIAAQNGIFTIVKDLRGPNDEFEAINVENICATQAVNPLWKITLPKKHSGDVIRLCGLYGISTATMFPGFDGAAKAVTDLIYNA